MAKTVDEAMEKWNVSIQKSIECGQKARKEVPEGGEARMRSYLACRMQGG